MSMFTPAEREAMFARIALTGPAGSGKTFTALTLATALSKTGRIALVDTELRALEYAKRFRFNRLAVPIANPEDFPRLAAGAAAEGHDVLIVDSYTHYWSGMGGALDKVDTYTDKRRGWSEYRPIENGIHQALLTFPGHVIVTLRVKTNYVTEENDNGRQKVRKLGMKPDARESIDYEFSIIGDMDTSHNLTITKTTCPDLVDQTIEKPGAELAETLSAWLTDGVPVPTVLDYRDQVLAAAGDVDALRALWDETSRRVMRDAPVLDTEGHIITLGNLIKASKATQTPPAIIGGSGTTANAEMIGANA